MLEYARVAHRVGVPPVAGGFDSRLLVEPPPVPAVLRLGIADAILAAAIGVPHAVPAVLAQHAGTRKSDLAALQSERDAPVPAPGDAIDRVGALQDMRHFIRAAARAQIRAVPHLPAAIGACDPRVGEREGILLAETHDPRLLPEGGAAILADREADSVSAAQVPAQVVKVDLAGPRHGAGHGQIG